MSNNGCGLPGKFSDAFYTVLRYLKTNTTEEAALIGTSWKYVDVRNKAVFKYTRLNNYFHEGMTRTRENQLQNISNTKVQKASRKEMKDLLKSFPSLAGVHASHRYAKPVRDEDNPFSPDRVQKILVELGFGEDNVASWNESIEVSFGVSSTLFIARVAIIYGLPFRYIDPYPELDYIQTHGGEIPKFVNKKIQSLSTKQILGGEPRNTIPENIFVYEYIYKPEEQALNVVSQIMDKFGHTKKFLYRGINTHDIRETLLEGFMEILNMPLNTLEEWSLLAFDWSDLDRNLTYKILDDLEVWKATVRGFICLGNNNESPPPQHYEDIIQGPISSNYDAISHCHEPVPLDTEQVVGKTDLGIKAFANRFFAIVYLR
ncbi:hypothetical protein C1646_759217 [Rhizophagus diaphanus]|nr:hypothetical protein C1646_759217 [Rhizophagus diaphanus] [Rhizophagus sp. MUCL 43196]